MNVEQIRAALHDRNLKRVSEVTGINYYTLQRFSAGKLTPRAQTLDVLRDYIKGAKE